MWINGIPNSDEIRDKFFGTTTFERKAISGNFSHNSISVHAAAFIIKSGCKVLINS
jgi:hypothetical protein